MQFHTKSYLSTQQDTMKSERYASQRDLGLRLNRSLQNLAIPCQYPTRFKFPKNRTCRKQTSMTMLIETEQPQAKPCVRVSYEHNINKIFQYYPEPFEFKKSRAPGAFHSLSLESRPGSVQNRSIQDIGVDKNRKKQTVFREIRNDPILIGDNENTKPMRRPAQEATRSYRDQGQRMKTCFIWQSKKPKSYLQRYKAAKQLK